MTAREQWLTKKSETLNAAFLKAQKDLEIELTTMHTRPGVSQGDVYTKVNEFRDRNQEFSQWYHTYLDGSRPYPEWLVPYLPKDINEPPPVEEPPPPPPALAPTPVPAPSAKSPSVAPKTYTHPKHPAHALTYGPGGYAWRCDMCSHIYPEPAGGRVPRWHCKQCKFDECDACHSKINPAGAGTFEHPMHRGHPLIHGPGGYGWRCDICSTVYSSAGGAEVPRWHCKQCKFDECDACHIKSPQAAAPKGPAPAIMASAKPKASAAPASTPATRGNLRIATTEEATAAFTRSIPDPPPLPQMQPQQATALRIQFLRVENVPGKPSDPYLKLRVSSWVLKREHVTKKLGTEGVSSARVATFAVKDGETIDAEVWEKKVLRDKKLGTICFTSAQWRDLRPAAEADISLPIAGGGAVVCKVTPLSAGTCGFFAPFPVVSEEDVRLLADKVARETQGLKSGFAMNEMKIAALLSIDAIRFELKTFEESRANIGREYAFANRYELDEIRRKLPRPVAPPDPWSHIPRLPPIYTDRVENWPLVETEEVVTCSTCRGDGKVTCNNCAGRGTISCNTCGGSGQVEETRERQVWNSTMERMDSETYWVKVQCQSCGGRGCFTCEVCNGTGRVVCDSCCGLCYTLFYYSVRFQWRTWQVASAATWLCFDAGEDKLSQEELLKVNGPVIWQEEAQSFREAPAILPANLMVPANAVVAQFMQQNKTKPLIHRQMLTLRLPVTQCVYDHPDQDEQRSLWIIGVDKIAKCPAFPKNVLGSVFGASKHANVSAATLAAQTDYDSYKRRATKTGMLYKWGGGANRKLQLREVMLADQVIIWFDGRKECKAIPLADVDPATVLKGDTTISNSAAKGSIRSLIPIGGKTPFASKRMCPRTLCILTTVATLNNAEELVFVTTKKKYIWVLAKSEGSLEEWRVALLNAINSAKEVRAKALSGGSRR